MQTAAGLLLTRLERVDRAETEGASSPAEAWLRAVTDEGAVYDKSAHFPTVVRAIGETLILVDEVERTLAADDPESIERLDLGDYLQNLRSLVSSQASRLSLDGDQLIGRWGRHSFVDDGELRTLRLCDELLRRSRPEWSATTRERLAAFSEEIEEIRASAEIDEDLDADARQFLVESLRSVESGLSRAEAEGLVPARDAVYNALFTALQDEAAVRAVSRASSGRRFLLLLGRLGIFLGDLVGQVVLQTAITPPVEHLIRAIGSAVG